MPDCHQFQAEGFQPVPFAVLWRAQPVSHECPGLGCLCFPAELPGQEGQTGEVNDTRDSCNIPQPGAMESSAVIPARAVGGGAELEGQE